MAKTQKDTTAGPGSTPSKPRTPRQALCLRLGPEVSEGIRELASGFGKPQAEVIAELAARADAKIQALLQEMYERYDRTRREKMGKLFGKPEPAVSVPPNADAKDGGAP